MTAKQLTGSILQLAIQGKLVPQDPNDEPARILLKQIREEKKRLVKEGILKKKDLDDTPVNEDEIPFIIPDNWEWTTISNIFIINPKVIAEDDQNAAFIPMEKIEAGYSSNYTFEVRKWGEIKKSFTNFADGDVAFAKITPCFQNRKSVIFQGLPNGVGAGTTELKVLRPIGNTIDRRYLLFFLKSQYFIKEAKFKGTANQQRIVVGYLENKYFPLPPLAEQHRIVQRIEEILPFVKEYGEAYEEASKMDAELPDKLKKSILQEAIMGKLGTQDPNDEPASVLIEKIRDEKKRLVKEGVLKKKDLEEIPVEEEEEPFKIPESWKWCKLGTIASLLGGFAFKSHEYTSIGSRVIRISDITEDGFVEKNVVRYPYNAKLHSYVIQGGDILMAMTGGTVGKSLYVKALPEEKMLLNQRVANIRTILIITDYIDYVIKSQHIQSIITDAKNSTNDNISMADIYNFPIPLPPLAEQKRIVAKIEQLFSEIDKLKAK